jgi:hypothetical protein
MAKSGHVCLNSIDNKDCYSQTNLTLNILFISQIPAMKVTSKKDSSSLHKQPKNNRPIPTSQQAILRIGTDEARIKIARRITLLHITDPLIDYLPALSQTSLMKNI